MRPVLVAAACVLTLALTACAGAPERSATSSGKRAAEHDDRDTARKSRAHYILATLARSQLQAGDRAGARTQLRKAIAIDPGHSQDWFILFQLEYALDDPAASATALAHYVRTWPEKATYLETIKVFRLLSPGVLSDAERRDLLQALFDSDWETGEAGASNAWHQLALLYLERGDTDAAARVVARIQRPRELVLLQIDRRFDDIVAHNPRVADIAKSAADHIDWTRTVASREIPPPRATMSLLHALDTAGRNQELLELTDQLLATDGDAPGGLAPVDAEDMIWVGNARTTALVRLGRPDEAVAEMERASRRAESGGTNVSQTLNLAKLHCRLGNSRQALDTLGRVGRMSTYGQIVKASIEHCANQQLGNTAEVEQALGFLERQEKDNLIAHLEALLRSDRVDQAAEVLITALASEDLREEALLWLQDYLDTPTYPGDARLVANRPVLLQRADVTEAINRVGRRERHPVILS